MPKKTEGGIDIKNAKNMNINGDLVGRDKNENISVYVPHEEKSGFAYKVEVVAVFIFTLLVGSIVLGGIGGIIGGFASGGIGSETSIIGVILGFLLAVGLAIANASNIKRYK